MGWRQIHRWLALSTGTLALVLGVSGASLALDPIVQAWQARPPAPALDPAMREVTHIAAQGDAGHGWRYFTDPAAHRAVVISPRGDQYLGRGKGLRLAFEASKAA